MVEKNTALGKLEAEKAFANIPKGYGHLRFCRVTALLVASRAPVVKKKKKRARVPEAAVIRVLAFKFLFAQVISRAPAYTLARAEQLPEPHAELN